MNRLAAQLGLAAVISILLVSAPASAQYAVGHRVFGGGTSFGAGYSHMDWQFPDIDSNRPYTRRCHGASLAQDCERPVRNPTHPGVYIVGVLEGREKNCSARRGAKARSAGGGNNPGRRRRICAMHKSLALSVEKVY